MRVVGAAAWVCVLFCGCAVGTTGEGTGDSGTKTDSGTKPDSGTTKPDSGTTQPDSGNTQPDTGTGNCGGQCLGTQSTCCSNSCVDVTSDPNNCGFCGNACGTQSCCAGNCVDTMGTDPNNCGGCGVTCSGTCTNGSCQTQTSCTLDMGSCKHSPCATGGALTPGCDPESVVTFVCVIDGLSSCCTSTWDASCVSDAAFWEVNSCIGGGC